jgi:protein TonB
MFKVLTGEKKRRAITPATITASVAAHLLLLGGLVYASTGPSEPMEVVGPELELPELVEEPKDPPPAPVDEPPAPPAPAAEPDEAPAAATMLEVDRVDVVPRVIPVEPPGVAPIDPRAFEGDGPRGPVITRPTTEPTRPVTGGGRTAGEAYPLEVVEEQPVLDRTGLARALERNYPAVLRDSRVSGRVIVELVVDEDGVPIEGSARVIEASHPAFGEATLRMAERFRFRPAKIDGTPVPVVVTIPIVWTAR